MKRLVVCCDGTWNRADKKYVTNIEKIARTVATDPIPGAGPGDPTVQQMVLYLSGVGTSGYLADRLLGGAFGFGLFNNIRSGYRWLALNYKPGDEIFVFGFSRGAYTARSLVGMIGRVGLLTRDSLIENQLPEAVDRYRRRRPDGRSYHGSSDRRFREVNSHDMTVTFLGAFDTVGALGVPGAFWRRHQFHDVELSKSVLCARQALAVDEHRMKFEPSLWEAPASGSGAPLESAPVDPRVKQVWFEGAHSDVGGGYGATGLSDTALEWMTQEAVQRGLRFDQRLLDIYVNSGSSAIRHDSMTIIYEILNLGSRLRLRLRPPKGGPRFIGDERVLGRAGALSVGIASSTATHYRDDCTDRQQTVHTSDAGASAPREWYRPRNIARFDKETDGFEGRLEQVVAHP